MSLPRLSLSTQDPIEIARVLRGALRLRTVIVPLVAAPQAQGLHLLDIEVPGFGLVTLLAEPTGGARTDGVPLSVRPATRAQMAELFALVERLDEPSPTVPPPSDPPEPFAEEITEIDLDGGDDDTVIDTGPAPASAASPSSASARRHSSISSLRAMRVVPAPSAESYIGRVLAGKYRIDAPIGKGAAATVYRATHKELRREVAIKILHAANQREAQFVRRFKAEALTASKLEHANVTRIIDFGQERDGELYLVMELVNGRPLDALLSTGGALGARRVVDIGIQVCRALAIAHDKGVIHRDIKPENIMIVADHDDDGEPCDLVKVCDFGLAKLREPDDESQEITAVGTVCGSPAYMSPEQIRAEPLDLHTDIYSLGVTLFEALTGALPHDGSSMNELFFKRCTQEPPPPSSLVPTVDALLDDVIVRAMAIDPRARQSSAHELRTELRTIRGHLVDEGAQEDHQTIIGG